MDYLCNSTLLIFILSQNSLGYDIHRALDRREIYYYVHGQDELAFVVERVENIL